VVTADDSEHVVSSDNPILEFFSLPNEPSSDVFTLSNADYMAAHSFIGNAL
jgi:hypothetical protein